MARKQHFVVTVRAINEDGVEGWAEVKVTAQYHRIVEGALVFRDYRNNDYPLMVRTFAHGQWIDVRTA